MVCLPSFRAAGVALAAVSAASALAVQYNVVELAQSNFGVPVAISDAGRVVGRDINAFGQLQAAEFTPSGRVFLNPLSGGDFSYALGVNSAGTIVGTSSGGVTGALRFNGKATRWNGSVAGFLGITGGLRGSDAYDISNTGFITGRVVGGSGQSLPFLRDRTGVLTLPSLPAGYSSGIAFAVNGRGDIAGLVEDPSIFGSERPFVAPFGGAATVLPLPTGAVSGQAAKINDAGFVVGGAKNSSGQSSAFLYSPTTGTSGRLMRGEYESFARGINGRRWIVGSRWDTSTSGPTGFLWRPGFGTVTLNSLLAPGMNYFIEQAYSINASGQIAARGYRLSTGRYVVVLLNPI